MYNFSQKTFLLLVALVGLPALLAAPVPAPAPGTVIGNPSFNLHKSGRREAFPEPGTVIGNPGFGLHKTGRREASPEPGTVIGNPDFGLHKTGRREASPEPGTVIGNPGFGLHKTGRRDTKLEILEAREASPEPGTVIGNPGFSIHKSGRREAGSSTEPAPYDQLGVTEAADELKDDGVKPREASPEPGTVIGNPGFSIHKTGRREADADVLDAREASPEPGTVIGNPGFSIHKTGRRDNLHRIADRDAVPEAEASVVIGEPALNIHFAN